MITPAIATDPGLTFKTVEGLLGPQLILPHLFFAVAVISIRPSPTSLATTTVVRVGRGSLKYVSIQSHPSISIHIKLH